MDPYPHNLVEKYLKASSKVKKLNRVVFKRLAPNVTEVQEEFTRLANKFEEAGIDQYAAMCYLGVAKCHMSTWNKGSEVLAYLKAARAFLRVHNAMESLHAKSNCGEYKDGALLCYSLAVERCPDDDVYKASIIREMTPLQPHFDGTSSFSSPAHRFNELELATNAALECRNFLTALQQLDDIVDNIKERKSETLYEELLRRVEILRLLLLVALDLPPGRQSPSHIKLIEFYYHLGNFDEVDDNPNAAIDPGAYITWEMRYALAEIIVAWVERQYNELQLAVEAFSKEFTSLNAAQRMVLAYIDESIEKFLLFW